MALPLTLPGFTDPAAGARRMLAAQVGRLFLRDPLSD